MIPPNSVRNLLRGLPAQDDGAGRVGPTMAARRRQIPQDIEGTWPSSPRQLSSDELLDMAENVSTPMGMAAGATRKVAAAAADRIPTLFHGTGYDPFFKFLREKMGKGLNRLGVGGYGTDDLNEGFDYLRTRTDNRPSHIITSRGNQLEVPRETATFLRSGDLQLEEAIAKQQKGLASAEQKLQKYKSPKLVQRLREDTENQRSNLYNLLTAADEGIAEIRRPGALLELGIDADPQKLINFDKDLIDQTPFVQDAMLNALKLEGPVSPHSRDQLFGFNNMLNSKIRTSEGSQALEEAGIQGVTARSSQRPGARIYSIFDPDRIAVLRALGVLGMLTGGMAGRDSTTTPQQRLQ